MKAKVQLNEVGALHVNEKIKGCPYSTDKSFPYCGDWCALFTVEVPMQGKLVVHLGCSDVSYEN